MANQENFRTCDLTMLVEGWSTGTCLSSVSAGTENSRGDIFAKPQKGADLISIKDVMAVLEKESQTLKSTQLYCLHERFNANERSKIKLYQGLIC